MSGSLNTWHGLTITTSWPGRRCEVGVSISWSLIGSPEGEDKEEEVLRMATVKFLQWLEVERF